MIREQDLEEKLREKCCMGDHDAVRSLIRQNVNVNSQNSVNGWTALHWACKRGHDDIAELLIKNGADTNLKCFKGDAPNVAHILDKIGSKREEWGIKLLPYNSPMNDQVDIGDRMTSKHANFSNMPTTTLPAAHADDLVLKVKIHGSSDPDFIEIEIPRWKLTYNNLLKICCEELEIAESQVERIRKLPHTRLRKDSEVKRLSECQGLEIVLKTPANGDTPTNCYQSISTCKNQTILY